MKQEAATKHFLVVENSADDALLIRLAFQSASCGSSFVCRNTSEAKAYLRGAGMYSDRTRFPLPDAILTDYRMEGETGLDLVRWVRAQPEFQSIPMILLSGSASSAELNEVEALGIYAVYRKPTRLEDLKELLSKLALHLCGLEAKPPMNRSSTRIAKPQA